MRSFSLQRRSAAQSGAAIAEAALTLTVFLMLIFGVMDFGRLNWERNLLSYASREGVRYAVVHGQASGKAASSADVANAVKKQAVGLDPNALTVTTTWTPDNRQGSVVEVQVNYSFSPVLPFIPPQITALKSRSQMVIAQ